MVGLNVDEISESDVKSLLSGNLEKLHVIASQPHDLLFSISKSISPLIIGKSDIRRVVCELQSSKIGFDEAQQWASFVRRGYFSNRNNVAIVPIDIVYDEKDESVLVECVAKLDELGDEVDGDLTYFDLEEMLKILG
jgi:hypothetical protein